MICHAGLVGISAGIVKSKKATGSKGIKDDLENAGAIWVDEPAFREGNKLKKSIVGYLFNRVENMGNKKYNHIGCEGEDKSFGDFLVSFVPKIGMRQKVRFTIETFD